MTRLCQSIIKASVQRYWKALGRAILWIELRWANEKCVVCTSTWGKPWSTWCRRAAVYIDSDKSIIDPRNLWNLRFQVLRAYERPISMHPLWRWRENLQFPRIPCSGSHLLSVWNWWGTRARTGKSVKSNLPISIQLELDISKYLHDELRELSTLTCGSSA